jgi:hypothetical protein
MAARRLLLDHLDMQPGRAVHSDLDPAEVGIVGDPAHIGGYHCGSDRVRREGGQIRDYSVTESPRDRSGLADWACALDIGEFRVTVGGRAYDLPHLSAWIVGQCKANAPDTRDIREVIWSPDGRTVKRWDRLGRRSTGDSSHRWHTHISYHRDAIKAGRDQVGLFRRYLTSIGLLAGEDDDVKLTDPVRLRTGLEVDYSSSTTTVEGVLTSTNYYTIQRGNAILAELAAARIRQEAILTAVAGGDQEAILEAIRAEGEKTRRQLDAQAATEAARDAELRDLIRQGQDGSLDAAEVVRRMGELLAAGSTPES